MIGENQNPQEEQQENQEDQQDNQAEAHQDDSNMANPVRLSAPDMYKDYGVRR